MKVTLERINEQYLLEAKGKTGDTVLIDNTSQAEAKGASPMELLLMSVGGCNAIDIIYILKKQRQNVTGYKVAVEGFRKEVREANPFERIHIQVFLEGDIHPEKAQRAAALSFEKYCSVSFTLDKSVRITYDIFVNGEEVI